MYTALAAYYDALMRDVDYEGWCDFVAKYVDGCGADLACGTGKFTLGLIERGKKVFGADISPQMLEAARKNATERGIAAQFVLMDMTKFVAAKPLDFVVCMCDGINYVKEPKKVFKSVYAALKNGGRFIFDLSSQYKLTEVIGNNVFYEDGEDLTYIWSNRLSAGKYVDMQLTFFTKDGERYVRSDESHRQYIHSEERIVAELRDAGYKRVTRLKKNDKLRLHFMAEK